MSIKIGDKFPEGVFRVKGSDGIKEITTDEYFANKKVVLFALPGAFTPTCSAKHLPGFINNFSSFIDRGVEQLWCCLSNLCCEAIAISVQRIRVYAFCFWVIRL